MPFRPAPLACLLVFGVPLFVALGRWELQGDEAIYAYAVERILETGDWLTPRYVATDFAFLEKPPLKFWLVGGLMALGITAPGEFGMRVFDPVFGALTFTYVLLIGVRLAGPACGLTAVLVLFTHFSLLFDHGLRSHNMDAALTLSFAGAIYHSLRWADGGSHARRHAWLASSLVTLGVMTKYIAAAPLPVVVIAGWIASSHGRVAIRDRWREWVKPAIASAAFILPWFLYQSARVGWGFWEQLLGQQVYERMTTGVDPGHLAPWHYYVTFTWAEFNAAGSAWLVAAGVLFLLWRAAADGADGTSRTVALWWLLPVPLISLGSSKLPHYVYPYLAPLALGAGLVVAWLVRWASSAFGGLSAGRRVLTVVGLVLVSVAVWTARYGPIEAGVFRNSSFLRPALAGIVLLALTRRQTVTRPAIVVVALVLLLPLAAYGRQWQVMLSPNRPLPALTACLNQGRTERPGVFVADTEALSHTYFYYLRALGPWTTEGDAIDEVQRRVLGDPAEATPVLLHRKTWRTVREHFGLPPTTQRQVLTDSPLDVGLELSGSDVLIVPLAARACVDAAVAVGGRLLAPDNVIAPTPPGRRPR